MGFRFRLPDIKGTDREQLRQLRGYLYQLIPQLQWALDAAGSVRKPSLSETASAETAPQGASAITAWAELGLSDGVSANARTVGTGCRRLCKNGQVFVTFRCTVPAELPVRVSGAPLPEEYRPKTPVCTLCPSEFSDGGKGIACAAVTPEGHVEILWVKGFGGERAAADVDGYISFSV